MSIHTKFRASLVGGAFAVALTLAACSGNDGTTDDATEEPTDTPGAAVEDYLDNGAEPFARAVLDADFEKAIEISEEYYCATDVAQVQVMADEVAAMSEEELEEFMARLGNASALPEGWTYAMGEVTEEDGTAKVRFEMIEGDESRTEQLELVKEDDEWKICGEFAPNF